MISLLKSGSTVTFTFDENSGYLQNGTIDVPVNSLSLITDESDMATFRKSASNDIFISARYEEFGMTKAELEAWYKEYMVGDVGGGVDSGTVQTMIDESISGKAESVSAVSSAEYVSSSTTINFKNVDGDVISSIDASDFVIDGMIDDVRIETISGVSYLVIDFNTASGKEDIQIPLTDIFDPSNYYTKQEVDASLSGKQATLVSGTNIKTINNESLLGSGNIDIQGGGSSYTAGRGIDITNDTISVSLPISAGTGTRSVIEGNSTKASGTNSHAEGYSTSATSEDAHSEGYKTKASGLYGSHAEGRYTIASGVASHAEGYYTEAKNNAEHASGWYNVSSSGSSTFGDSGNTLFSVGNGTEDNARHNAFEIRQNGDIYLNDGTNDVKLQDTITATAANTTALGGLSLVKLTQAQYDALATKDNSTLYVIVN